MKNILHLFRIEKFTEGFIEFMNSREIYNNMFWVYGDDYLYDKYKSTYLRKINVKYYPRIDIKLNKSSTEKQMEKFDLIIYHGVFEQCIIDYFFLHRVLMKKLALYFWGGDKNSHGNWQVRMRKKYVVKNAAAIITIIPQDYVDIKREYHPKGKHFRAKYFDDKVLKVLNMIQDRSYEEDRVINIQIGNSATETNNHIDVFDVLKKYKDKKIKIYLPLSYGNIEYAEKVTEYGKKIFDDKLIVLREFMTLEKYCLHIQKMDIGIFNMTRQQGLGNIYLLMQNGCKIYFNKNGLLWNHFVGDLKCVIKRIDEIDRMTFEQFTEFSEKDKQKNRELISTIFSGENLMREWENIFQYFN